MSIVCLFVASDFKDHRKVLKNVPKKFLLLNYLSYKRNYFIVGLFFPDWGSHQRSLSWQKWTILRNIITIFQSTFKVDAKHFLLRILCLYIHIWFKISRFKKLLIVQSHFPSKTLSKEIPPKHFHSQVKKWKVLRA